MSSPNDEYMVNTKNLRISYASFGKPLFGLLIFWIAWYFFLNQWLGSTTMGSMWAKNNFDTQYWVYIQPDNAESKYYRVKADISRADDTYSLTKIYWANGGYLTFDDCTLSDNDGYGVYSSDSSCTSSKWINDDEGYEHYSIRVEQKGRISERP